MDTRYEKQTVCFLLLLSRSGCEESQRRPVLGPGRKMDQGGEEEEKKKKSIETQTEKETVEEKDGRFFLVPIS